LAALLGRDITAFEEKQMKWYRGFPARCTVALLALACSAVALHADPVTLSSGSLTVGVIYTNFVPTIDVDASLAVLNVGSLGTVIADTFAAPPPNPFSAVLNTGLSEAVLLTFSLAGVDPSFAILTATGTPFTAVTDPALAAFLAPSSFTFVANAADPGSVDLATGNGLLNYTFAIGQATPVPEPGTIALLGGVMLLVGAQLRKRKA
jgi:hypothetical protein